MLEQIIAHKRDEVARRKQDCPLETFQRDLPRATGRFLNALSGVGPHFILECKKASPSRGLIRADFDPATIAARYDPYASAISVLTDEHFFQGSLEFLPRIKKVTDRPLLCKDFVVDPYQIYEARRYGADAILLMMSVLQDDQQFADCLATVEQLGMDALVEVHSEEEMERVQQWNPPIVGINNRDLKTLKIDLTTCERLAPLAPAGSRLICESGIRDHADVRRFRHQVDGFLVGSALMAEMDLDSAIRRLLYGRVKVCGLKSSEQLQLAQSMGAIFGGLIFYPPSSRAVELESVLKWRADVSIPLVGVFVNEEPDCVLRHARSLELSAVQLHGDEDQEYVKNLRSSLPADCAIWKAISVCDSLPIDIPQFADRLLLDTKASGQRGGSGQSFDWNLLADFPLRFELVLAGGLNRDNAEQADDLGVWCLDVNSGVEESPGKKSPGKLKEFFEILRAGVKGHTFLAGSGAALRV